MKPEDRKRLKQHIEMIVEHKTPIEELEDINRKLRLELHTLRFKESQEQRFIWWVYNVYSKNVCDLIYEIMGATTYDTEGEAKEGKYGLPKHCFDLMKRIDEYTEHIYDGSYLDVEISTAVKTSTDNNKLEEENKKLVDEYGKLSEMWQIEHAEKLTLIEKLKFEEERVRYLRATIMNEIEDEPTVDTESMMFHDKNGW
jgi:hypothetical protein